MKRSSRGHGASGYAGLELVRLLARHPGARAYLRSPPGNGPGRKLSEVFPALTRICRPAFVTPDPEAIAAAAEVVFTSVPHQTAMEVVPRFWPGTAGGGPERRLPLQGPRGLRDNGISLTVAKELLAEAVYGLPEIHGYAVSRARLVGNPGCYPTCRHPGTRPPGAE